MRCYLQGDDHELQTAFSIQAPSSPPGADLTSQGGWSIESRAPEGIDGAVGAVRVVGTVRAVGTVVPPSPPSGRSLAGGLKCSFFIERLSAQHQILDKNGVVGLLH